MIIKIPPYYATKTDLDNYLQNDLWYWMHEVNTALAQIDENSTSGGAIIEVDANSGKAFPVNGVLNIVGGTGVSTSAGGNTVTINIAPAGFTWQTVTSADNPVQIVVENSYICAGVSQVVFVLPLAPNIGDTFKILSYTSTFQITENGSQQIRIGTQITTAGSGNIISNSAGDNITCSYVGGNVFLETQIQGTLTVS